MKGFSLITILTFVPLLIMAFWIGLYPKPFFQILEQPVSNTMAMARPDYKEPGKMENAAAEPMKIGSGLVPSSSEKEASPTAPTAPVKKGMK